MPPCGYVMTWMFMYVCHEANVLMQTQFIQKFLLFSKRGFHNAWTQNIFTLDLLFMKSHLPFDLGLPKNWWSLLENLRMGRLLEIWWSSSKDLFSQFWLDKRGGTFPRSLFLEKWIIWKSSISKRFIFVVLEYDNLASVKTHRDRFGQSKEGILEQKVQIFGFGKGRGPHRGFGCCPVVALPFFCLLCPRVFENFLASALDCPFGFSP